MKHWFENLVHGLKHPPIVMVTSKEWNTRKKLVPALRAAGYHVDDTMPNPMRLYAWKGCKHSSEKFLIDIIEWSKQ